MLTKSRKNAQSTGISISRSSYHAAIDRSRKDWLSSACTWEKVFRKLPKKNPFILITICWRIPYKADSPDTVDNEEEIGHFSVFQQKVSMSPCVHGNNLGPWFSIFVCGFIYYKEFAHSYDDFLWLAKLFRTSCHYSDVFMCRCLCLIHSGPMKDFIESKLNMTVRYKSI